MRSMNVYWKAERGGDRTMPPLDPRRRRERRRFVTVDCMAASTVMSTAGIPCGAYPLPDGLERIDNGELKLKMCWNDLGSKQGSVGDA